MKSLSYVYLFPNGMVAAFDEKLDQVPDLQGPFTKELHEKLKAAADRRTQWNGYKNTRDCDTQQLDGYAYQVEA